MNQTVRPNPKPSVRIASSVCPHDCPSTCALDVEVLDERTIGRVHGSKDNDYTAGVVCAKVARYAERIHHPDRLTQPLIRRGAKGTGSFAPISWDSALDLVAEKFLEAEARHGSEAVWPYQYAGTMGLVMRDGIHRLRHAKKYSGFHSTICINSAYSGFAAGIGKIAGPDPREMAKSDLVVIWGTNPVNTQVNVMTHATRARKERGAKIVAVDIYMNGTMEQADLAVLVKPGTDAALACAVMHCLFRDGKADWDYLDKYTDAPRELEAHVKSRVSSARGSARSSGWATALPARATARSACMRRPAFRRSPALGSTRAAARSTTTLTSTTGTSRRWKVTTCAIRRSACSTSPASARS
jgi:anaerobic selenocysteine-containing dehydrogenase